MAGSRTEDDGCARLFRAILSIRFNWHEWLGIFIPILGKEVEVMPVYSLASCLGFMEQENRYLLVVKTDDIKIALEVSEIDRVIWTENEAVIPLPAMVKATQPCFREALVYGKS